MESPLKYFLLICISLFATADIVEMEDGTCYEKKGKMHYIVPCPTAKRPENGQKSQEVQPEGLQKREKCIFRIGEYQLHYIRPEQDPDSGVSCIDAQHFIGKINPGYDKSLKQNKKYIGKLIVRRALSTCRVEIYYGDFITIGLMSGDRLMCDSFMVDLPRIANTGKRRY